MKNTFTILALLMMIMGSCTSKKQESPQQETGYVIALHGGSGNLRKLNLTPEEEKEFITAMDQALEAGKKALEKGATASEAVVEVIGVMEDSPLFNAGKGAVFNHDGFNELDASIMDGKTLDAGAASGLRHVKNPIRLVYKIMKDSKFVFLSGAGAEKYARKHKIELVDSTYFYSEHRWKQLQEAREKDEMKLDHSASEKTSSLWDKLSREDKLGTVGCVVRDRKGNLAAGTSTGGLTNKDFGRIGDSPIIGSGTYANNKTCAVSCTGKGEDFIRLNVAHEISAQMMHGKKSLEDAVKEVIQEQLKSLDGRGGCIAIDCNGNVVSSFTTSGMYRGWLKEKGVKEIKIY